MRILLSATIILLAACSSSMQTGDPADDVRLRVSLESAAPGDSVTLTLENGSEEQIGYNLCASGLQRQTAAAWQAVPSDIVCTMELRTLDAGGQTTWRTALPATLESGRYRYTTNIEAMATGGRYGITSDSFRVDR
jgi:hypothetical protein